MCEHRNCPLRRPWLRNLKITPPKVTLESVTCFVECWLCISVCPNIPSMNIGSFSLVTGVDIQVLVLTHGWKFSFWKAQKFIFFFCWANSTTHDLCYLMSSPQWLEKRAAIPTLRLHNDPSSDPRIGGKRPKPSANGLNKNINYSICV